jgi:hypothetical protein
MKHPVTENDGNNGSVVHKCNLCGDKSFKEICSLNGNMGIHRQEEYKRMCMMAEQQPVVAIVNKCIEKYCSGQWQWCV